MTEHTFASWDGAPLFYRAWLPESDAQRALLLFHRGHEHSERWQQTVDELGLGDVAIFAWDQRGHGRSPGERGHAKDFSQIVKDADCFARHLEQAHGISLQHTAVLASSIGAVVAAAWVHDFAPPVCGLVLAAPAFRVKLYVPLAIPLLRLKQKLLGPGVIKSYIRGKMITRDPQQAAAYDADPLIFRQIAVNILLDLHDTGARLVADAGAIRTPTLLLVAGKDWVVQLSAQRQFFQRLGSPIKQFEVLPGFYHCLFAEKDRACIVNRTRRFLQECYERPWRDEQLLSADKGSFTRTEYDLLRAPSSPRWSLARAGLKTVRRLSTGINLGWQSGFDSGLTLDYIYENKPRGLGPLGRAVDYFYLNAVGWKGIRARRENLERLLCWTIRKLHGEGRVVNILDIASGPGRYILEVMHQLPDIPISAMLRDNQQHNLDAARSLADRFQLCRVSTKLGDAFDRTALANVSPRPNITIVSGLYELFPDNAPVCRSLHGIADAMEPDGYLIYTCQPWHPQIEMIARTLINREGNPWIMRRRTQSEMDALVRAAGFEKICQEIDRWGIFTVCVARRLSA